MKQMNDWKYQQQYRTRKQYQYQTGPPYPYFVILATVHRFKIRTQQILNIHAVINKHTHAELCMFFQEQVRQSNIVQEGRLDEHIHELEGLCDSKTLHSSLLYYEAGFYKLSFQPFCCWSPVLCQHSYLNEMNKAAVFLQCCCLSEHGPTPLSERTTVTD